MGTWGRAPALGLMVSVSVVSAMWPSAASQEPGEVNVVLDGRGYGHGVGLPQDGALALGRAGSSAAEILATFYPGTTLGRRSGPVRAHLLEKPRPSVTLAFPSGGAVHDRPGSSEAPGFPVTVEPGGSVRLSIAGGRFTAEPLAGATAGPFPSREPPPGPPAEPVAQETATTTTVPPLLGLIPLPTAPPPPTTAATVPRTTVAPAPEPQTPTADRSLWAVPAGGGAVAIPDLGRRYRGRIEAASAGGALQLLNDLDVEVYLRGMGEVIDPTWPAAGLQAQAIVARTYALDAMADGRPLCSTQQCQVYLGEQAEYAAMNQAVAATQGQVLFHGGSLAEAVYSASAGGVTATPEEGFGMKGVDYPYLKPVTYSPGDPQAWELRVPLVEFARRLGYRGPVRAARVSRAGPSGRPLEILLIGEEGDQPVDGMRVFSTFSLRSTLYTLRMERPGDAAAAEAAAAELRTITRRPANRLVLEAGNGGDGVGRQPWAAAALVALAAVSTAHVRRRLATPAAAPARDGAQPAYTSPPRSTGASPGSRARRRRRSGPEPPPDRTDSQG